jgi:hypothetical protein
MTERGRAFRDELVDLFRQTFGSPDTLRIASLDLPSGPVVDIETPRNQGIELRAAGRVRMDLQFRFRCRSDDERDKLTVLSSTMSVRFAGEREPLFHFDFVRGANATIPAAHINIHAHRNELTLAMIAGGLDGRGRRRMQRLLVENRAPRMSDLHFPVGGTRFRPCIEDILVMLIDEFGVDSLPGARDRIEQGRRRFRSTQLGAAIRDDPEAAAEQLELLGYRVAGSLENESALVAA